MEITLLVKSILGLVAVLGFLIFVLVLPSGSKKKPQKPIQNKIPKKEFARTDLEFLRGIIKDKNSDENLLKKTLELIIKHHGKIPKKIAARPHPDFEIYRDILFRVCRHPNTNKHLIVYFDKELTRLNQEYKSNINDTLTRGLNSRGL
jgi:hypothetical protein